MIYRLRFAGVPTVACEQSVLSGTLATAVMDGAVAQPVTSIISKTPVTFDTLDILLAPSSHSFGRHRVTGDSTRFFRKNVKVGAR